MVSPSSAPSRPAVQRRWGRLAAASAFGAVVSAALVLVFGPTDTSTSSGSVSWPSIVFYSAVALGFASGLVAVAFRSTRRVGLGLLTGTLAGLLLLVAWAEIVGLLIGS